MASLKFKAGFMCFCGVLVASMSVSVLSETLSVSKLASDGSSSDAVILPGVDVDQVKFSGDGFELVLSSTSNDIVFSGSDGGQPADLDSNVDGQCENAASSVQCSSPLSPVTRTTTDEVVLRDGTIMASALSIPGNITPELVVLDLRSSQGLPPSLRVWMSETPGGDVLGVNVTAQEKCELVVSSFSGRLRITFDDASQRLQDNACVVSRSNLVFINMAVTSGTDSFTLQRVIRLTGI